jgi:hypothetical protein
MAMKSADQSLVVEFAGQRTKGTTIYGSPKLAANIITVPEPSTQGLEENFDNGEAVFRPASIVSLCCF